MDTHRKKIAVLGGGMGALTAVWELTESPEYRDRLDITVYQVGWQLGGKGASGRNRAHADRIEEHGLHVLLGFYEQTFRVMREVYRQMGRSPDELLATWDDAVKPHSDVGLMERVGSEWKPWMIDFPIRPGTPGDGIERSPSLHECIRLLLHWLDDQLLCHWREHRAELTMRGDDGLADLDKAFSDPAAQFIDLQAAIDAVIGKGRVPDVFAFYRTLWLLGEALVTPGLQRFDGILSALRTFKDWLTRTLGDRFTAHVELRRLWIVADVGLTLVIGLLREGLLRPVVSDNAERGGEPRDVDPTSWSDSDWQSINWQSIDDKDLREWLRLHGASQMAVDSAMIQGFYDLAFTGPGGAAAGMSVCGILNLVARYKGSVFYKMQAGMGETVFAPLYLVLAERGVKFKFFHRVDELHLNQDGTCIDRIDIGRQVDTVSEYQPLFACNGLPCWPTEPFYEQIVDGEQLRESGENLNAWPCSWPDAGQVTLRQGVDYDHVILGISIGAFPHICGQLIERNTRFANMVARVETTQTQALQLWMKRTTEELGWRWKPPVLDGFEPPFSTWAVMNHLLPLESWEGPDAPVSLAYLCHRLDDMPGVPAEERVAFDKERVREHAVGWLETSSRYLWPDTGRAGQTGFDWSVLVDPQERDGEARLQAQYWQATYCPSERYVLSVPGSTKYRLAAGDSGFENLVLAGDYVRTAINAGCIEAATLGGMDAARATLSRCRRDTVQSTHSPGDEVQGQPLDAAPAYISRGGELLIRHPLLMVRSTTFILPLRADHAALAEMCERYLNRPAQGRARYTPIADHVSLVCAHIERGQALGGPDADKGWLGELDVGLWIPVLGADRGLDGRYVPNRQLWFQPYMFVDNAAAVATGREVFGFPKQRADIRMPTRPEELSRITVDALAFERYDPQAQAQIMRLMTAVPQAGNGFSTDSQPWSRASLLERSRRAEDMIARHLAADPCAGWNTDSMFTCIDSLLRPSVPMVFLKQFPDVADPDRACFQAVVETSTRVQRWYAGGLLPAHDVYLADADSHPIVRDLGLPTGQTSRCGFWVRQDFTVQRGRTIHRSI